MRLSSSASKPLANTATGTGGGSLELDELELLLDVELLLELEVELLLELEDEEPGKPRQTSILPTPVLASTCGLTSATGSAA